MTIEISVIVPIFNEEESIPHMHAQIVAAVERTGKPFEMIFADDGSTDRSFEILRDLAARDPRVVVLKFRKNAGQTAAMTAGIEYARGRMLVTMDGDLQNDPADIPMMLEKAEEGYDLVIGWRQKRKDEWLRMQLSKVANRIIGKVTGVPVTDNGCSLKIYRADIIKRVPLYSDMHRFIPAMCSPLGARVAEVAVNHREREFGVSKYGFNRIFKVLIDLIVIKTLLLFARRPLARFLGLGAAMGVLALIWIWAVIWGLGAEGSGSLMMHTAIAMLFGSAALFLMLLGFVATLIHRRVSDSEIDWLRTG